MSAPSISARPARRRRSSRRPRAPRCVYVGYEPPAPKGEAILVPEDSPLKSVADLKGKNVALNKGSNVHYLLVKALEKAGVGYARHRARRYLPPADARAAFEQGAVDAWVIWDPFLAAAQAATGARQLTDGTGLVANHQFYLASRAFADAQPDVVKAILADRWRGRRAGVRQSGRGRGRSSAPASASRRRSCRSRSSRHGLRRRSRSTTTSWPKQQKIADTFYRSACCPRRSRSPTPSGRPQS